MVEKQNTKIMKSKQPEDKETNKEKRNVKVTIYLILRILVIISLIVQVFLREWGNVFLCIVTLIAFTLPNLIANRYKIELPNVLESIVYLFIFASAILGEINNFYEKIPFLGYNITYIKWFYMCRNRIFTCRFIKPK